MKKFAIVLSSLFALTAFANESVKFETAKPVYVEVKAKRAEPSKSEKPAVKNQATPAKPADAKATAK
jgi:hypothetical protein